jgi:glycosyltransferase involved in cell wall biosynthesis/GT2 family glycosyltransferase
MPLQRIEPGASIGAARDEVVLCLVLDGPSDSLVRCLDSVVRHTSSDMKLLVCGSLDPRVLEFLEELMPRGERPGDCLLLEMDAPAGGLGQVLNAAIDACAPADLALLTNACTVPEGWLESLRATARSDARVATVSALSDRAGALALADGGGLPVEWTFASAAAEIGARMPRYPRMLSAVGPCIYLRRSALELVGVFDQSLRGDAVLIDFSQRALARGLIHLVADNVLISDHGALSDGDQGNQWLATRYPYLEQAQRGLEGERAAPVNQALASARMALRDLRVTLDARTLTPGLNGTKLHVLELITALARTDGIRVRAVVPHDLGDYAQALVGMPGLELLRLEEVSPQTLVDDVVHRPHQVSSVGDLDLFDTLGRRLVITQQDLINFHNPAYFSSGEDWEAHRRLTRTALALADQVVFFSHHVAEDARREGLLEDARGCVVPIGVDHQLTQLAAEPSRPKGAESLEDGEFLVCLGADLGHKNRPFAIDLLRELRERHGWKGKLVLAGPAVTSGSSAAQELEAQLAPRDLDRSVLRLGSVDEAGKAWLLSHAAAVVYPSVVEGFGLVPFEAAQAGIPCLFASGTALAESLPPEAASIVPWSAIDSADRVIRLLSDQDARAEHLRMVKKAGVRFTWRETAEQLLSTYRDAVRGPAPPGQAIAAEALERERQIAAAQEETAAVRADAVAFREDQERRWAELGDYALDLVGPHGAIPAEMRRPLLAVSTRRFLRRPFFAVLKAGYSLSRVGRRHRN